MLLQKIFGFLWHGLPVIHDKWWWKAFTTWLGVKKAQCQWQLSCFRKFETYDTWASHQYVDKAWTTFFFKWFITILHFSKMVFNHLSSSLFFCLHVISSNSCQPCQAQQWIVLKCPKGRCLNNGKLTGEYSGMLNVDSCGMIFVFRYIASSCKVNFCHLPTKNDKGLPSPIPTHSCNFVFVLISICQYN